MKHGWKAYVPYGLLTAVVMAPLLLPGYILTLDAIFAPHLKTPKMIGNDMLWHFSLRLLNYALPSQLIEKMIFVTILLSAAICMHQLIGYLRHATGKRMARADWGWAQYAAATFYTVNPFTYDRFMAGQYEILLGYALLPLAVRWLLEFEDVPGRAQMLRLGLLATLLSIVSIPTLGEVAAVALVIMGVAGWRHRKRRDMLRLYLLRSLAAFGLFLLLSSYWLAPLMLGQGTIATSVKQFSGADTAAFATTGSTLILKAARVLQLQGFWAESHGLFRLPQAALPGWGTIRLLVWGLLLLGTLTCWRCSRRLAAIFGLIGVISIVLTVGIFAEPLTRVGYREPQKFVGLLAVVFAVFIGFGAARLTAWARRHSEMAQAGMPTVAFIIILLYTPTMYWGFARQLRPREYPVGWFTVDSFLRSQPGTFRIIFLPWHEYMSFDFAGRIIATPGELFFMRPVIVGNNPEIGKLVPPEGSLVTQLGKLVTPTISSPDLARQLANYHVRYVLLAKDYDYRRYSVIVNQPHFLLVRETASINLYENMLWKGGE